MWYPDWQLRRPDAPQDEPCQAVGDDNRVVARNDLAAAVGVQPGMRRREAEALCPTIVTVQSDPGAEAAAFEPVATAIEEVIPRIEVTVPGLVFAPVAGAIGYYGGEIPLVERIVKELNAAEASGYRIGLASGPFAARRAAERAAPVLVVEDDAAFLASLDVATLGHEDIAATFKWLGITTLGALAQLPRDAVVSRFGRIGAEAHRLASGRDRVPRARAIPQDRAVEERFEVPLDNLEQAFFIARSMAHRLIVSLASDGVSPYLVVVEAESATGRVRARTWRSNDPFDEATLADRVRWQLRAWLAGEGSIGGGVVRLRIAPDDLSDEGRQLSLHEDAVSQAEADRALAQAQSIVGVDRVLLARPQGGRDPAERVSWYRWGETAPHPSRDPDAPWPGAIPAPTPALVPPQSTPLTVEWDGGMPSRVRLRTQWVPVLSWAGPWRKMGRWWEGEEASDRYQLVTSAGAFLVEVRDGITCLIGIYD